MNPEQVEEMSRAYKAASEITGGDAVAAALLIVANRIEGLEFQIREANRRIDEGIKISN